MAYTLDALAGDMKQVLSQGQTPAQLEQTRQLVEKALKDKDFVEAHLGDNAEGERKIDRWYARHAWCRVDMSDCPEAFANLNTEEEKARLELALTTPSQETP